MTDVITLTEAIADWEEAKRNRDKWVAEERTLRTIVANKSLPHKRVELSGGRVMSVIRGKRYKLKDNLDQLAEEALKGVDPRIVSKVIKWEPKFVKGEYSELSEKDKKAFDKLLTVKDAMVTVKIEEAIK